MKLVLFLSVIVAGVVLTVTLGKMFFLKYKIFSTGTQSQTPQQLTFNDPEIKSQAPESPESQKEVQVQNIEEEKCEQSTFDKTGRMHEESPLMKTFQAHARPIKQEAISDLKITLFDIIGDSPENIEDKPNLLAAQIPSMLNKPEGPKSRKTRFQRNKVKPDLNEPTGNSKDSLKPTNSIEPPSEGDLESS